MSTADRSNLQVSKRVILFGLFTALVVGGIIGAFVVPYLRDVNASDVLYVVGIPTINMTSYKSSTAPMIIGTCNVNASLQFACMIPWSLYYHGFAVARVFNKSGLAIQLSMNVSNGNFTIASSTTTIGPHASARFYHEFQTGLEPYGSVIEFYMSFTSQCLPYGPGGCSK